MKNTKPVLPADKLLNYLLKTVKCNVCKQDYSKNHPECPFCEHVYSEELEQEVLEHEL